MPGIAVVSALNPKNYGMYSVDLAAESFFGRLGLPYTPVVTQYRRKTGRLTFQRIRDPDELARFDTVVYWGDFLNNPMYGTGDYSHREVWRHGAPSRQEGIDRWRELYLDVKRRRPGVRVMAVGGCFLGAEGEALAQVREPFQRFLETADLIAPRDERSLEILRALAPQARLAQGIDCAWLLPFPGPPPVRRDGTFVWFLGRSLRHLRNGWVRELSRRTGLRAVHVDWLNLRRPRFLAHWNFERLHRLIAGAEFVVTDAYHLVINALNRRVRAVCLYRLGEGGGIGPCADPKKAILLEQVGMPELLVQADGEESLARSIHERIESFGPSRLDDALSRFEDRRDGFRRLLASAVRSPGGDAREPADRHAGG